MFVLWVCMSPFRGQVSYYDKGMLSGHEIFVGLTLGKWIHMCYWTLLIVLNYGYSLVIWVSLLINTDGFNSAFNHTKLQCGHDEVKWSFISNMWTFCISMWLGSYQMSLLLWGLNTRKTVESYFTLPLMPFVISLP